jgi:hypothetical protein
MDVERSVVHAREALALGQLLQQYDAETPPIGRRAHAANDGFRRGIARQLERGYSVEIEVGQSCGTEPGDHKVERILGSQQDGVRIQIAMPKTELLEAGEGSSDFVDQPPHYCGRLGCQVPSVT